VRLGILISGRGSNFEAIANSIAQRKLDAEIAIVIANKASAGGLEIARQRGIPMRAIPSQGMDREAYDKLLVDELRTHEVELVCLAGFMRLLSANFVRAFPNRVLNIHPSLLPAFPGLDAQRQALEHGVKVTGCTVHFVDAGVDSGAIIGQQTVPVLDHDTAASLMQRIHTAEYELYPKCLKALALGRISVVGRHVYWKTE